MTDQPCASSRGWMKVLASFGAFWTVALLSQTAASALMACIAWLLGNPLLPPWIPFAVSCCTLAGGVLGSSLGARRRGVPDLAKTIATTAVVQAVVSIALAFAAAVWGQAVEPRFVALLLGAVAINAVCLGMAGPAWLVLVGRWPGERSGGQRSARRLLLESSQFQLANFAGPLLAGLVIGSRSSLVVTGLIDAVSWGLLVGYLVFLRRRPAYATTQEAVDAPAIAGQARHDWRPAPGTAVPLAALLALALAVDSPRAYLARLMQDSQATSGTFSLTMATVALSAATVGLCGQLLTSRLDARQALGCAFASMLVGLGIWAMRIPAGWVVGAIGIGAGTALGSATVTAGLVAVGGAAAVRALAVAGVIRRVAGAAGGLGIAVLVSAPGPLPFLPSIVAAAAGLALVGRGYRRGRTYP